MEKIKAGEYEVIGVDGVVYRIEREWVGGNTYRGWAAMQRKGNRWVGTRFWGETLKGVEARMRSAGKIA